MCAEWKEETVCLSFLVPSFCICVSTSVSACVWDNLAAGGMQAPPPPWKIKAINAAQDVGAAVIHKQKGQGCQPEAPSLTSTSSSRGIEITRLPVMLCYYGCVTGCRQSLIHLLSGTLNRKCSADNSCTKVTVFCLYIDEMNWQE